MANLHEKAFYHVDDLRERDLQGDIKNGLRVLHRPQRARVVVKQIIEEFPSKSAVGASGDCGHGRQCHQVERTLI